MIDPRGKAFENSFETLKGGDKDTECWRYSYVQTMQCRVKMLEMDEIDEKYRSTRELEASLGDDRKVVVR